MSLFARTLPFFYGNTGAKHMKRQWLLSILVVMCLVFPSGHIVSLSSNEPPLFNTSEVSENLHRVYGENFAPAIYSLINLTNYMEIVREFSELGSRYIMSYSDIPESTNEEARYWLIDQMTEYSKGRIQIEVNGNFKNIIGRLPGYLPHENNELPVFIVSAHYDTRDGSPGANKDGSGIAVLLELIRIFSTYEWPLDILFIAFNGEHAMGGLLGSKELSNQFLLAEIDILAMYNVDTILRQYRYADPDEKILLAYNIGARYWAELAKTMGNYYGTDMVKILPASDAPFWSSSSNYHFAERGFQNILSAYESGYMNDYISGTVSDIWSRNEFSYYLGRETAAFIGASLAFSMSRAYGQKSQLFDVRTISTGFSSVFYIPISTPTTISISSRWYGSSVNFSLINPNDILLNTSMYTTGNPWEPTHVLSYPAVTDGLYELIIDNTGSGSVGVDVYIEFDSDIDNNGVNDSEEYWLDIGLFEIDSDNDTISDALEIIMGLDPNNPDSDFDLMPDAYELQMGFDPLDPSDAHDDADNDSLTNLEEYFLGLNPLSSDSDFDGMDDAWELAHGLNPLVDDAHEDPDNDKYTNIEEYQLGTDPQVADVEPIPMLWIAAPVISIILMGVVVVAIRRE
ncbi:M28 family peptidase [Candidatus Thorarchaeota archaeon]|nr:MAG: M28 family peptidase [Candidatus Thorarchaeota archaeon]